MNNLDPDSPKRKTMHAGFRVGFIAAAIMVAVHLFLLLIFRGENRGDLLAWGIQLFVYFFGSQVAAQQHYNSQERDPDALRGVRAAGVGAALTTSFCIWVYIILRGVFRDALGIIVLVEPFSLFCMIIADVLLAIGLGTWGGRIVEKKYKGFEGYNSDNF